ncbi:MAG: hypothetical protein GQ525_14810 [Draconibacterium sp.]|nr:hypothetical protein [Draconibacterium sp.]
MNLIKNYSYLISLIILLSSTFIAVSQSENVNDLTKAIQLFDKENFNDAQPIFKKILDEKPDDFMVNYFYGACRTENNHFTNADLDCLILANQEVSPININYYFGVQYHARSNWERALKFYTKYKSSDSPAEIDKNKILEKIQQCYDKINPYEEFMIDESIEDILADTISNGLISDLNLASQNSTIKNDTNIVTTSEDIFETEVEVDIPKGELINFKVNNEIIYKDTSHFKTEKGKDFFLEGNSLQKVLDLSLINVDVLREEYSSAKTREEKSYIGEKILAYENEIYKLKSNVFNSLIQAKSTEAEYWQSATEEELKIFNAELALISADDINDTINTKTTTVTPILIDPSLLLVGTENTSPASEQNINDLIYKIQIGAYSRGLPNYTKKLFNKLSFIRKIENYTDEKGIVVYTTGNLTNYDDAVKMKNQVRQEGIKDAYIVPYLKGKRITLEQAKEL